MAAHLESSRRDRTPCRSYFAAPRQRRRHGTRSARFSGASSPGRRNAASESPPASAVLDQIVAAGRLGRKAPRELRDGAQIFLHPPSILAESRSLSQVDSRFLGGPASERQPLSGGSGQLLWKGPFLLAFAASKAVWRGTPTAGKSIKTAPSIR